MTYIVHLDRRHCDCMVWNHTGIPCKHATVVILGLRKKLEDFCYSVFSKGNYLKVYSSVMEPIPDQVFWPELDIEPCKPPMLRRRVGRPTIARRRGVGEPTPMKRSFIVRCGKCGASGHNKRSCAGGPVKKRKSTKPQSAITRSTRAPAQPSSSQP